MAELLVWLYIINSVLLINHEIDSAYWHEWELFKLPGGITGFLIIHFPLLFIFIYGLIPVYENTFAGIVLSLVMGATGIFAFFIHTYFIRKGRKEFNVPISLFILRSTLLVSTAQVSTSIYLLAVSAQS